MKFIPFFIFICIQITAQNSDLQMEVDDFQKKYTAHYSNHETSPFKKKTANFKGHDFFPVNIKMVIEAVFVKEEEQDISLFTSTSRLSSYNRIGKLVFEVNTEKHEVSIFYSDAFLDSEEYSSKAFLPYTDLTNGDTSYTNGRYTYVQLPKEDGELVVVNFNLSTNPYCAYVDGYSCTYPPKENHLTFKVEAGIKKPK